MTHQPAIARDLTALVRILESRRLPLSAETATQGAIAAALTAAGLSFAREHRLSPKEIVDFWCPPVVIEVKIRSPKRALYRQCARYCAHEAVGGLILATTVPISLDRLGKPTAVVNLGRAWL